MAGKILFIGGIDTNIGKTIITGLLGKYLKSQGYSVITQKPVQTGCDGEPEDILIHRQIMGEKLNEYDKKGITCSYKFKMPASPHLAAKSEGKFIDPEVIISAATELTNNFDYILIEGAGGLHVPFSKDYCTLDFLKDTKHPVVLVTSSKLGSINHTLLSLEVAKYRKVKIQGLIYNRFPEVIKEISNDSYQVFKSSLKKDFPDAVIIDVPEIHEGNYPEVDFGSLI